MFHMNYTTVVGRINLLFRNRVASYSVHHMTSQNDLIEMKIHHSEFYGSQPDEISYLAPQHGVTRRNYSNRFNDIA